MSTNQIYILRIEDDICGVDTKAFSTLEAVHTYIFDVFTDWDQNEDSIDDIDSHLRENSVGSIEVTAVTLN